MIGIIGAMDIEIEGFRGSMTDVYTEKHAGIEFIKGKIDGKDVALVMCGIGKVSAAICTQMMIDKFSPDVIINTGVAGGLHQDLGIGDVAVAKDVVQHDVDTTIFGDPMGYITNLNMVNIPCDEDVHNKLYEISKSIEDTNVISGTIATGDQFISTPYQKNQIKDTFDAIAAEMEGGSIGHVCYQNNVKFGIIRAISDNASGDALMDYESFKLLSAQKTIKIVTEFVKQY
jgi:adenosylhomocysteine nucleosidase